MSSQTGQAAAKDELHLVFVPFLAPGHMNPMVDMAILFAAHGVNTTIITTPCNASLFQRSVEIDGLSIQFKTFDLPSVQAGLPVAVENLANISSPEMAGALYKALKLAKDSIESMLRDMKPDYIIGDIFFPYLTDLALKLNIPRLAFDGGNFINSCIEHCLTQYAPHRAVLSDSEVFIVPGLPDEIRMTRLQLPDWFTATTAPMPEWLEHFTAAQQNCYGKLVNTFSQLEPAYEHFSNTSIGLKSWSIGPVSTWSNKYRSLKFERRNLVFDEYEDITNWLDARTPGSVIYVCFGTLFKLPAIQLREVALGLESSGKPFILVVRNSNAMNGKENSLPDRFEQRMIKAGNGYIIYGWAPQLLILKHPAVGGFLTHCGWNSIIEGVSYGLPMVTWPQSGDQFHNEKLVTDVLKIGVSVGASQWFNWTTTLNPELISRDKIHKAVNKLMETDEESEAVRKRVKELANAAQKAINSNGTSQNNLMRLIDELKFLKCNPK